MFLAMAGIVTMANAANISLNVTDNGPGAGAPDAGDTAGAFLLGNWNTIGSNGALTGAGGDLANLTNSDGVGSGVTLSQSAPTGGNFNAASAFSGTIGDSMMTNYADTTGNYTYTFGNLNAGVGAVYDVYIYSARGYTGNTGITQLDVNGESLFLTNDNMVGDYVETGYATQAEAEANLNSGNYVKFSNVSLDTLVVSVSGLTDATNGGFIGAVNGIQIVQVPEPSSTALLGLGGVALLLRRRR